MISLVELLSRYEGGELSKSDFDALESFVEKNVRGYEIAKVKQKISKLPLGVSHFGGAPHNPVTGYELVGEKFSPLLDENAIGQYATKRQWESINRKVMGEPSITVNVWKKDTPYYSIENTKEA